MNYTNIEVYSIFSSPRYLSNKNFLSKYINKLRREYTMDIFYLQNNKFK